MTALGRHGVGLLLDPPPGSRAASDAGPRPRPRGRPRRGSRRRRAARDRLRRNRIRDPRRCSIRPDPGPLPLAEGVPPPGAQGDSNGVGVGVGTAGRSAAMAAEPVPVRIAATASEATAARDRHRREPVCVATAGSWGAGSSVSPARRIRPRGRAARGCRLRSSRTAPSAATTASTTEVHASRSDTGARETTVAGSELLWPTTQRTVLWTSTTPRRCTTTSRSTAPLDGRTSAADHRDGVTAVAATVVAPDVVGRAAARRDATDRQGHARDGTRGGTPRVEDVDERHARPRTVRPQGDGLLQVGDRPVVDDARRLLGDEARRDGGLPGGQESGQGDDDEQADGLQPRRAAAGRPRSCTRRVCRSRVVTRATSPTRPASATLASRTRPYVVSRTASTETTTSLAR